MDFYDQALEPLRETLPAWWDRDRSTSELTRLLTAFAELVDALAAAVEGIYADQALTTSRDEALRREWAVLYGAGSEQLPTNTETLRAYLTARAAEDGSIASLEETLLSLTRNPANTTVERGYLIFPAAGTGLLFPADGSAIFFPTAGRLEITEVFASYRLDVTVRTTLVFDRALFARAVARFRQAHMVASTITEN